MTQHRISSCLRKENIKPRFRYLEFYKMANSALLRNADPLDQDIKEKHATFKNDITNQALDFIRDKIPRKILHFNQLIKENSFKGNVYNWDDLDNVSYRAAPIDEYRSKRKKKSLDEAQDDFQMQTPVHKQILEKLQNIKNEVADFTEMMGIIRLWIQLNVPRIEDGNNFGVGIQEDVIGELNRVDEGIYSSHDMVFKYYMARAKLWTKVLKYPNVSDYSEAIRELDEKQWVHIKFIYTEIRNNYSMLYDLICKVMTLNF